MTFAMKKDKAFDPLRVSFPGALRIVFEADGVYDLFEEFFRFWRHSIEV